MMKQLFIFLLSLIALTSTAQYKRSQMTRQYTPYSQVGGEFRTVFYPPLDTMVNADIGALAYSPSDSSYYVKRVNKWERIAGDSARKDIYVYLIAGQSNAQGYNTDGSNKVTTEPGSVLQWYQGVLKPGNDPVGNANVSSAWPAWGRKYYSLTGKKVCFVPSAFSGTSQTVAANTGQGTWDTTGTMFDTSVARVNAAMNALKAAGFTPIFKGILWLQGETDAIGINGSLITQSDYTAAFQKMIGRYRSKLGKRTPFYIYQIATQTSGGVFSPTLDIGYSQIRAAQVTVANNPTDSLISIVFTNAFDFPGRSLFSDQYHYKQKGYNEMGTISAANIISGNVGLQPQEGNNYTRTGNIGIGTGVPTFPLQVVAASSVSNAAAFTGRVGINRTTPLYGLDVGDSARFRTLTISNLGFGGATSLRTTSFLTILNDANIVIQQSVGADYPEWRFAGPQNVNVPYSGVLNGLNFVVGGVPQQPLLITTSTYFSSTASDIIVRPGTNGSNRHVERSDQSGNANIRLETVNNGETIIDGKTTIVGRIKAYTHNSSTGADSVLMWNPIDSTVTVKALSSFATTGPASLAETLIPYGDKTNLTTNSPRLKYVDSVKAVRVSKLLAYKQVQAGDTVFRFAPRKYNYGFGNSLMAGSAITPDYFRYFTMFCNFTNDLEVNYGIGGTRLCHVSTGDSCMLDRLYRIKNYNAATDDYFVFEYGVNDAVTLSIDTATFRATYYQVIDTAIIARGIPVANITLVTPGFYLHNNSTLQNRGPIFTDLVKSIAAAKGVKVVDARAAQVLAGAMATLNLPTDSVHWNEYGNEAVALAMIDTLNIKSGVVRANGNLYGRHLTIRGYANKTPFLSLVDTSERIVAEVRAFTHISTGTQLESLGFGINSLIAETSGNANTAFGSGALASDTSGSNNSAYGNYALTSNTSGSNITAFGKNSFFNNTTGSENVGIGRGTGQGNTTASDNTYGGYTSGVANTTSSNNTGWGAFTLNANTASSNTATGASSLRFNTSGGSNTANGTNSLLLNLTGSNNTAVGNRAGRATTAGNNTYIGANAGDSNTTGDNNFYGGYRNFWRNKTGVGNIGLGSQVGTDVFSGSHNIFIGGATIALGDVSSTLLISAGDNSPRIYSPASGKVMIGSVNTPTTTLHVDGDLRIGTVASSTVGVDSLLTVHNGVVQAIAPAVLPAYSEGAYMPTLTGVANVDGTTADSLHYYRYGNNVTVYGAFQVDPTLNLVTTQIGVSLVPGLASNFTLAHQASGGVNLSINGYPGKVYADATNDRAQIEFVAAATSNMSFTINFTYKIQ